MTIYSAKVKNQQGKSCSQKQKLVRFLLLFIFCWMPVLASSSGTSTISSSTLLTISGGSTMATELTAAAAVVEKETTNKNKEILIVFSDLDGTLIHYPKQDDSSSRKFKKRKTADSTILHLPPSSTGMRGVVSSRTLALVQAIRSRSIRSRGSEATRQRVLVCLVSGMRTTTLLKRLPFLPKADAYCTEAGGRIFYPVDIRDGKGASSNFVVYPERYDGATDKDLKPFGLVEDIEWRQKMQATTGDFYSTIDDLARSKVNVPLLKERDGLLWDFARHLIDQGYVLDMKGYSACFRVNRKQQPNSITDDDFAKLTDGTIQPWDGLDTSVNLSCVDFYPADSGKKNCCQYLAEKFCSDLTDTPRGKLLGKHAVCLCDDDNDLEMARACQHAYIPDISSDSMAQVIADNPDHFTKTGGDDEHNDPREGTLASEKALSLVLSQLPANSEDDKKAS